MPPVVTLTVVSIWLTSGRTLRLMRPSLNTVGVKSSLTPNCLNSTEIAPLTCDTGIGKFAAGEETRRLP